VYVWCMLYGVIITFLNKYERVELVNEMTPTIKMCLQNMFMSLEIQTGNIGL
jgi:hypothetical protein